MANCRNCGAPLEGTSPVCAYCGTRNAVDLLGISASTTEVPQTERICPVCDIRLKTVDVGEKEHFYIEKCGECGGLFFDSGELQAILEARVDHVYQVNLKKLNHLLSEVKLADFKVVYRKCPVCGEFMHREGFGEKSGVVVDHCRDHGIWLDSGELTRLMEWKKAGGEILDEKRKAGQARQQAKEAEREFRELQQENSVGGLGLTRDFHYHSGRDLGGEILVEGIFKLVGKLFR